MSAEPADPGEHEAAAQRRRTLLWDLERAFLARQQPDYEVIGTLAGATVVARRVWGHTSCTPTFRLAVERLVESGVWLHYPEQRMHVAATSTGDDLPVVITLMRALDTIISARLGDLDVTLRSG